MTVLASFTMQPVTLLKIAANHLIIKLYGSKLVLPISSHTTNITNGMCSKLTN